MSPRIEYDQRVSYPGLPEQTITTTLTFDEPVAFSSDPFALQIAIEVSDVPPIIRGQQRSERQVVISSQPTGDGGEHIFVLHPPPVPIPVTEVRLFPDGSTIIDKATSSATSTRGHQMNSPHLQLHADASVTATAPKNQDINLLFFRAPLD